MKSNCTPFSVLTKKSYCFNKITKQSFVNPSFKFVVALSLLLFSSRGWGQSTANYAFTTNTTSSLAADLNSNSIDMTTGTNLLQSSTSATDQASSNTAIGFDFFFMGSYYNYFSVNNNGLMKLGNGSGAAAVGTAYANTFVSTSTTGGIVAGDFPVLSAFWDDLNSSSTASTTKTHYRLLGSAPNRCLVVEWKDAIIAYNTSTSGGGSTWQVRLYETTGKIEYVYGTMTVSGGSTTTASIGFASGTATNSFVNISSLSSPAVSTSASTTTLVNSATTGAITGLNSSSNGSRRAYIFTPPSTLASPTSLSFTSVTTSGMTLNWTASSPTTNVVKYAIYNSTDNTNFTYVSTVNVGTNTYAATGLTISTLYYWKVYPLSEGALGTALSGSQSTASPTTYYWTGSATADFNTAATWNTAADNSGSARSSALSTDILIIDGAGIAAGTPITGGTITTSATVSQLKITNNTAVTLASNNTTQKVITISGNSAGDDFVIGSGSTLNLTNASNPVSIVFSGTGTTGDISGTLTFGGSTTNLVTTTGGTGTLVNVSSTGVVNMGSTAVSLVGSTATLAFSNGSNCNVTGATTGAYPIPLATWSSNSTVTLSGSATSNTTATNNVQSFGNFVVNLPSLGGTLSFWTTFTTAVIQGNLIITATGSNIFRALTSGTLTVNGNLNVNGGTFQTFSNAATFNVLGNINLAGGTLDVASGGGATNLKGNFTQTGGTLTQTAAGGKLSFNGTSTQTFTPATHTATSLSVEINNTLGVTLSGALNLNKLTLTAGNITTGSNVITIISTVIANLSGGSSSSYVNGKLARTLPANLVTGSTYTFPIGKGSYNPFELVNPTTTSSASLAVVQAEVFDASSGGSAGTNMCSIYPSRYWAASITANSASFTNTFIKLTDANVVSTSAIASSSTLTGSYAIVGSTTPTIVASTSVQSTTTASTSIPGFYAIGTVGGTPTITAGTITSFGTSVCINTTTSYNSFTVSGSALTGDITVGALTGFTYCVTTGGTYTSTLTLTPGTCGALSLTTVYVKFTPTAVQSYNGNIVLSGGGATSVNVAAVGSGVNTAATATSGASSAITSSTATVAGSYVANCQTITAYGIEYSITSGFTGGTGLQVASANQSSGSFTSSLTSLNPATTYFFRAYATYGSTTVWGTTEGIFTTPALEYTSATSGNWNSTSTWTGGVVPVCGSNVTIASGHNVTVNSSSNVSKNLTIATTGTLTVALGDLTVGCTLNNTPLTNNGTLTVSGGTLNINGNLSCVLGSTFNQSGGNINIDGNNGGSTTGSVASGTPLLNLLQLNSGINWTGGTLTIVDPHTATTNTNGYAVFYSNATTGSNYPTANHTIQFGDGISSNAGGHTSGFYINQWASNAFFPFGNLVVNGPVGGTNRDVTYYYNPQYVRGSITVNIGGRLETGNLFIGGDLIINTGGVFTQTGTLATGTLVSNTSTATTSTASIITQTFSGSGTFRNLSVSPTANLTSLTVNNTSSAGVNISAPLSISGTLTMTAGKINTTSTNLLTLGTSTAAGTLAYTAGQIAGPFSRTFAASRTAAGTYDATTLFPVGDGTTYLPIHIDPTTTSAGAVVVRSQAFNSNSGVGGSGVATTLSSNRWEALATTGSSNLTNSFIGINDATIASGRIIVQSTSASGTYNTIAPSSTYTAGSPNSLRTATSLANASYTGYFTHAAPGPVITSFSPLSACPNAATTFTITGTNLGSASSVTLNGEAFTITNNTATSITITTDATPQAGNIIVTTSANSATSPTAVTLFTLPTVTATSNATSNTVCSGTAVTLNGGGATSYTWNNSVSNNVAFTPTATSSYTVTGTDANGCTTTASISITVNDAVAITTQPANQVVLPNANATFSVAATGTGLSYQWQENTGSSWSNITNTGIYSGATTNSLTLTGVTSTQDGYQYRVQISGTTPCTGTTSNTATLTISTTAISAHPQVQTICSSTGTASFSITTTGTTPTYQWQVSTDGGSTWNDISGETNASLSLSGLSVSDNAKKYRCVLNGGSINSNSALLTVYDSPSISAQPSDLAVCSNATSGNISVAATSGSALTYQWQVSTDAGTSWSNVSGANVSGASSNTLSFTSFTSSMDGYKYKVIVSTGSPCSSVTSDLVTLSVTGFSIAPSATTVCANAAFTINVTPTSSSPALSYSWTCATAGSGATSAVTTNPASITPTVAGSYTYALTVTGGSCTISANQAITVNAASVGGTATASVSSICVSGTSVLSLSGNTGNIQWQQSPDNSSWSNVSSGGTSASYTTPTLTTTTYYRANVTNTICSANTSNVLTITVNNPQVTGTTAGSICASSGTVSLSATASPGATLNWYAAATGGTSLASGTNYTTPSISSTTPYYVSASQNGTPIGSLGKASPTTTTTGVSSVSGLVFNLTSDVVLNSVNIYNNSTTATRTMTIQLQNSSGTVLYTSQTFTVTGASVVGTSLFTCNLGWNIPAGTGYRLVGTLSGAFVREASPGTYPFSLGSFGSITGGIASGLASTAYFYFYNWNISSLCETSRTTVTATLTAPPTISASANTSTICSGQPTNLTASSANSGYTYTWSNSLGNGASVSASPTSTSTYTVTGTDNSGGANNGCTNTATVAVAVNPSPSALTITPSSQTICNGAIQSLAASGGTLLPSQYSLSTQSSTYSAITGTGVSSIQGDDYGVGNLSIGFNFPFNGTTFSVFGVSSNGFIELGSVTTYTDNATSGWTPSSNSLAGRANIIAPLWDDNNTTGGTVIYSTSGSAPNRILTVQWTGMHVAGSGSSTNPTIDMQLILNENGNISFKYGSQSAALSSPTASIGITGNVGNYLSVTPLSPLSSSTTSLTSENTSVITTNIPTGSVLNFLGIGLPIWSSTTGLFTDASATTAYTSLATTTVYANPSTTTTYTATATASNGCTTTQSVAITVNQPSTTQTVSGTSIANGDYLWNGNTSTDGSVASNWYVLNSGNYTTATTAPTVSNKVFIVSSASSGGCVSNSNYATAPASGTFNANGFYLGSGATFNMGSGSTLVVKGDFINAGGTFNAGSETVTFNGTSAQTIGGSVNTTFNNLTVDNSVGLTVSKGFTINGELKFSNGNITAASSNEAVTFETSGFVSTTTGSLPADGKCIVGYCKKNTNSTTKFTFPVGSSTVYRPASITPSSSNLTTWTANYVNQGPTNFNVTGANIDHVSRLEYWNIDRAGASPSNATIELTWNSNSVPGTNFADMIVAHYTGTAWETAGGNAISGTTASGVVSSDADWATFSPFTLGSKSSANPLPVVLSNFTALCKQQKTQLNWITQSELNNDYFTIERSKDGSLFNEVGRVNGNGTTNLQNTYQFFDELAYQGTSYYRLSQHDFNGAIKVYPIKTVSCADEQHLFSIYPNPNNGTFEISGLNEGNEVVITDVLGKKVGSLQYKSSNEKIQLNTLKPGVYFVEIKDAAGKLTIQKVIIEY